LVDDDADFRFPLTRRLDRRGLIIREASTGEEALAALASFPADVVLLDVHMPGMGGMETLRRIRESHPKAEVLMLTGHADVQDGVLGIKSGAFDYLSKPVEFEQLFARVRQACDKGRHERAREQEAGFRRWMEQRMAATERLASLGTLAAGIAHEINNPLAIIAEAAGWMRMLLARDDIRSQKTTPQIASALDKLDVSVARAKKVTHQLLGFARHTDTVVRETDVRALAEDTVRLLRPEAESRRAVIEIETATEGNIIWSDPDQLRQVLLNLVANALHASSPGRKVRIHIACQGGHCDIQVRDKGTGIPKDSLEKIFEPFYTTKPPGAGTGLGLSVSRGIVEKLGGSLSAESVMGQGSCFTVRVPRVCEAHEGVACDVNWLDQAREMQKGE
jgi:signal transduction histidine kinase